MIPISDTNPNRSFPVVTWLLIFLNGIVFLYELNLPEKYLLNFFYEYGLVPARYTNHLWAMQHNFKGFSILPFFTSMFLHANWLHFIFNIWTLWIFGDNVEDKMGKISFLIFYILSGFISNFVHFIFNFSSTIPTIGASGAISAVMGAYMWMFPFARIVILIPIFFIPYFIEVPAFLFIGFWFLSQLFSGVAFLMLPVKTGSIAWWAHIGGFITGIVLLPFFKKKNKHHKKILFNEDFFF